MPRLHNKNAIITGAAAGIGQAIARRFVKEGARVLIADVDEEGGLALVRELGDSAHFCHCDVSKDIDWKSALYSVAERWGSLDILVNNAGIVHPSKPVQSTTDAEWLALLQVNLTSVFLGCRAAYAYLKATQGCVLNISSMAGISGQENHAAYAATKGGINALTKSMAVDWGGDRIRVNALCPAGVWTPALRDWAAAQPNPANIEDYLNRIHSLGYCPEAAEIASVATFLCSDDARFVTGAIMPVSGGSECGYKL